MNGSSSTGQNMFTIKWKFGSGLYKKIAKIQYNPAKFAINVTVPERHTTVPISNDGVKRKVRTRQPSRMLLSLWEASTFVYGTDCLSSQRITVEM